MNLFSSLVLGFTAGLRSMSAPAAEAGPPVVTAPIGPELL